MLSQAGEQVSLVEHGKAALDILEDHSKIVLVLSDLMMPVMGGKELLTTLQNRKNAPNVLLMTGYAGYEAEVDYAHWVAKPFASDSILRKMRALLE
ncbi:MAG: response regulator [Deltaproteobacteria bacterium]|nr:response regulator [Deltaproteobacteria bacterium]